MENRSPADYSGVLISDSDRVLAAERCPDVLWSYSLEHNRWNYISPSIEAIGGYSVDEALDRSLEQLLTQSSFQYFKGCAVERLEEFLKDETRPQMHRDELETIAKDGSKIRCDVTSQCTRNEHGELTLVGVVRAVLDRSQIESELRASEEKYKEILSSIEEGYYESDLDGNLTFFNDAACRMYGYSREEFTGISYKKLYKEPETVFDKFSQVYESGLPETGFTLEMLRRDGSNAYVEISISPMRTSDGTVCGFRGVARDITERMMFLQQLEYYGMHDQLTGLYNRTYFEEELRRLSKSRDYPITMISADVNGLKVINDTMGHDHGDQLLQAAAIVLKDSLRGSDVLARVGGDEYAAVLPNADEGIANKVISRIRQKTRQYCDEHPDLYLSLSLGAATTNDSDTSFTDLFKKADDEMYRDKFAPSSSARNKIVKSLMNALNDKDYIGDGHGKRLAVLCRKVGNKIGLSQRQQADLALLAQVHDLGKVGIPDQILFKTEPLNDDEWNIIRQHPEKGYRIALSSNFLTGIASLILKHHERWDGSGYPLALKGREIPVECRIFAIADAYDAMTNMKPYSQAKTCEEAVAELNCCAGHQFDPEIVSVFEAVLSGKNN